MNKIEVARRQLGTALHLFLLDVDPVSVHCLACGGGEIAEWLANKSGTESFMTLARESLPDATLKGLRGSRNQHWNAFKHATQQNGQDRDDDALFANFRPDDNEHYLFIGWLDYMRAGLPLPIEALAFLDWYLAKRPDELDPQGHFSVSRSLFPQLMNHSRDRQRARLIAMCQDARAGNSPIADPQTDARPLILP